MNILEANIAMRIVSYFNRIGVECSQMGIIAPYQSQVQHLQNLARESMPGLEVIKLDFSIIFKQYSLSFHDL